MSMKHSVDEIKTAVDTMLADSNAELDRIESSIIDEISKEEKKTEEHITWLNKLMEDYISNISSCKPSEVITFNEDDEENILVQIPDIIDPVVPEFKKGRIIKEEIKKLFGSISFCTLSERKMPKENDKINLKSLTSVTSKPTQQQSMKIPFSLKKLQGVDLSFRNRVRHLSPLSSGKFWASDSYGHLFQFDLKGNIFKKLNIGGQDRGFHTVTKDDDLLYTDYNMKAIYKMNSDLTLNDLFITTGDWEPWSVYCSLKSGDILVGMTKDSKWKITRYSNEGVKLHDIRRHDNGKELYSSIGNITENINGDVCTIDYVACKLVVVTRSGDYRFHYAGFISHSSLPSGICTDILGNILHSVVIDFPFDIPAKFAAQLRLKKGGGA
ncbi:uncharacterized protein LOC134232385 [Saccostrea cucullata]|uniref:uncharacterized protein LOC134232385 n=1 Tax=Saccostrea cuccullata TaxID=36930 RepID=UPI002ECFDD73